MGIYDTHVEELDQLYTLTHLSLIQRINLWENGEYGHLDIYLKDLNRVAEVKSQLLDIFPQDYKVTLIEELLPHFFEWFKFLDRNIVMIIVLIMIVAAFNMISVLLIMIMERTPMIGLLKSLGRRVSRSAVSSSLTVPGLFFTACCWAMSWRCSWLLCSGNSS